MQLLLLPKSAACSSLELQWWWHCSCCLARAMHPLGSTLLLIHLVVHLQNMMVCLHVPWISQSHHGSQKQTCHVQEVEKVGKHGNM